MTILGAAGALAAALPVLAHHSFSAEFDVDKPVKLEGTVVKMDWVNPHSWLYLDVNRRGRHRSSTGRWRAERQGPAAGTAGPRTRWPEGTRIIVNGHRSKDGAFRANSSNIQFPDGRKLDTGSSYAAKTRIKTNSGRIYFAAGIVVGMKKPLHDCRGSERTRLGYSNIPSRGRYGAVTPHFRRTFKIMRKLDVAGGTLALFAGGVFPECPRGVERSVPAS